MKAFNATHYAFLLLSFALITWRCAEDIDDFIPDPELKGNISEFYAAAREDISSVSILNIDFPTAVVTPRKTVLIFQPKSLVDDLGNIASGLVEIEILELLTKGEILLYGIPTNSFTKLLSSGGEFYIKASQGGQRLRLVESKPVRILTDLKGADPQERMELFYTTTDSSFTNEDVLTWYEADGNPNTWNNVDVTEWVALADSQQIIEGFGYESFSDQLDWINLDVFLNIPVQDRTDACVALPPEYGKVNTVVYMVFKDRNSVIKLRNDPEVDKFCSDYGLAVPIGDQVALVVISHQGDDSYRFALIEAEIRQNFEIAIYPEPATVEEIKEVVGGL